MARKRFQDEGSSSEWLNTYADMVTLLLTFFILLYSMSSVDDVKWQELVKAFDDRFGTTDQVVLRDPGDGDSIGTNTATYGFTADKEGLAIDASGLPADFDQLFTYINQYLIDNNLQDSVEVQRYDNSIFIRFKDNIFFDPDSPVLRQSGIQILSYLGDGLKSVENNLLAIKVNGHTAAVPGVENYRVSDRTLSTDRANSVVDYFEINKKIDAKKLLSMGYGKNYPVATNETPEGREQNRRVDMMILSDQLDINSAEDMKVLLDSLYAVDLFTSETDQKEMTFSPEQEQIARQPLPNAAIPDVKSESITPVAPEKIPAQPSEETIYTDRAIIAEEEELPKGAL